MGLVPHPNYFEYIENKIKLEIMKTPEKQYKIVILDDDNFYASLMQKQLEQYAYLLAMNNHCKFKVNAYTRFSDFMVDLEKDTDLIFLDYYLSEEITGDRLVKQINEKCAGCKTVIISNNRNKDTAWLSIINGADGFIHKDKTALSRSCFMIESLLK